eukprot:TRINITY_DN2808_c0_g1_i1.p1 TRINITY_DN2808_c0_g1~~TRINITY_DN2808_c0_g1_i1.p1  ORF type:complete len:309 (+),score=55.52 TRINITY_DN2808_c0_g1_i1:143-1069(+)
MTLDNDTTTELATLVSSLDLGSEAQQAPIAKPSSTFKAARAKLSAEPRIKQFLQEFTIVMELAPPEFYSTLRAAKYLLSSAAFLDLAHFVIHSNRDERSLVALFLFVCSAHANASFSKRAIEKMLGISRKIESAHEDRKKMENVLAAGFQSMPKPAAIASLVASPENDKQLVQVLERNNASLDLAKCVHAMRNFVYVHYNLCAISPIPSRETAFDLALKDAPFRQILDPVCMKLVQCTTTQLAQLSDMCRRRIHGIVLDNLHFVDRIEQCANALDVTNSWRPHLETFVRVLRDPEHEIQLQYCMQYEW